MKNPLLNDKRGFSMVELLIAGVIIAMTSSLLIGGLMAANRSGELRVQQAIGAQIVASQFAMINDSVAPDDPNEGACPEPYSNSSWNLEQQDTPISFVKRVRLTVTHEGHDFHAASYRLLKEPQP